MKKTWINFGVDLAMFVSMTLLAGIGVIMKWVLPPGTGGGCGHHGIGPPGTGHMTLLGMGRHEWGDLHLWVGGVLLGLLVVHVVLHWTWIKCRFQALAGRSKSETVKPRHQDPQTKEACE